MNVEEKKKMIFGEPKSLIESRQYTRYVVAGDLKRRNELNANQKRTHTSNAIDRRCAKFFVD